MDAREILGLFPALSGLSAEAREKIASTGVVRVLPEGSVIAEPGHDCRALPLIARGAIRIEAIGEDGRSALLYEVTAGETCVVTASCLLSGQTFPVRAVVSREATALMLPPREFSALFASEEAVRRIVVETLAARLAAVMGLVEAVLFARLDVRIARWLAGEKSVEATHEQISERFATARQVVSRILGAFQEQGWISQSRGRIEILDARALAAVGK